MKMIAAIAVAAATALSLAGCEANFGGHHAGVSVAYVDGYYDDAYGPWYDGYWGSDDYFYYRAGPSDTFHRDDARHFSHQQAQGAHSFHGRMGQRPVEHG
jgi:hypothetical protein